MNIQIIWSEVFFKFQLFQGTREAVSEVSSAATVGMLRDVLYNNAFYIRKTGLWQYYQLAKNLRKYRDRGHYVKEWILGTAGHYAGWHCSWCFRYGENRL